MADYPCGDPQPHGPHHHSHIADTALWCLGVDDMPPNLSEVGRMLWPRQSKRPAGPDAGDTTDGSAETPTGARVDLGRRDCCARTQWDTAQRLHEDYDVAMRRLEDRIGRARAERNAARAEADQLRAELAKTQGSVTFDLEMSEEHLESFKRAFEAAQLQPVRLAYVGQRIRVRRQSWWRRLARLGRRT